jgi:hypothetical protein
VSLFIISPRRVHGGANDPIVTTDHRTSQYAGDQAVLALSRGPHYVAASARTRFHSTTIRSSVCRRMMEAPR